MTQNFDIKILYQILIYLDSVGWTIGSITHIGDNVFEIEVSNTGFLSGESFTGTWKMVEQRVACMGKKNFARS